MHILRQFLIGNVAFQAALALPGPPVNHDKPCKITKVKEVITTKHWALWTQTREEHVTKTAIPSTKTITSDTTQIDYQTVFAPTTVTSTSTATVSITAFTSTETDTVTSTTTSTTTTIATTAAVISPSPSITNDQPAKRDNRGYYPPPPPPCETIYKTNTITVWVPTVAHKTVTKTKTVTPAAVTKTLVLTGTNIATTTLPSTVTSIATATATNTISTVTTTTTTATVTATQTVAATPTYALSWDQDACAYSPPYPHIIDIEIAGDEQTVVDSCANICTQDSNCLMWEAYYQSSVGSGRCATFAYAYNSSYLRCPFPFFEVGYSVAAEKLNAV